MAQPTKTRSAGGVVLNSHGHVLVVNQRGRSWSLPKGHLEAGEDALAAARREITEETGVTQLDLVSELLTYERPRIGFSGGENRDEIKVITLFLFRTSQMDLRPIDPDNPEARWVAPGQVAGLLTHERDKAVFIDILTRLPPR